MIECKKHVASVVVSMVVGGQLLVASESAQWLPALGDGKVYLVTGEAMIVDQPHLEFATSSSTSVVLGLAPPWAQLLSGGRAARQNC